MNVGKYKLTHRGLTATATITTAVNFIFNSDSTPTAMFIMAAIARNFQCYFVLVYCMLTVHI